MLLVVACHAAIHLDWGLLAASGWKLALAQEVVQLGQMGVAVFFMLSGYFLSGARHRPARVVGVWAQVATYAALLFALGLVATLAGVAPESVSSLYAPPTLWETLRRTFLPIGSGAYWFMTSYVVLLLLAPFVNRAVDGAGEGAVSALAIGGAVASSTFVVGLQPVPFTQLVKALTCYLVGACVRRYPRWRERASAGVVLATLAGGLAAMALFNYACAAKLPVAEFLGWAKGTAQGNGLSACWIAMAWALVAAVARGAQGEGGRRGGAGEGAGPGRRAGQPAAGRAVRLCARVAPLTFGVYLVHENWVGYRALWGLVNRLVPVPQGLAAKAAAFPAVVAAVFAACALAALAIDRLAAGRAARPLRRSRGAGGGGGSPAPRRARARGKTPRSRVTGPAPNLL